MEEDNYLRILKTDKEWNRKYYGKSLTKTEQQKYLEELMATHVKTVPDRVLDAACGGGTLSHHVAQKYPAASYSLLDYNEDALTLAREHNPGDNFTFRTGDVRHIPEADGVFDLVFFWQTLHFFDDPQPVLDELLRVLKPGGWLFASSLFNLEHDVDLFVQVLDHTLDSSQANLTMGYNTFCQSTIEKCVADQVDFFKIFPFRPQIDFHSDSRGMGSRTVKAQSGERLTISGGLLMNYGVLVLQRAS